MLAPRKTLWSTPQEAMEQAIAFFDVRFAFLRVDHRFCFLQLTEEDVVYDIGCGDGRFLVSYPLILFPIHSSFHV